MQTILLADTQNLYCTGVKHILQGNIDFCIIDVAKSRDAIYQQTALNKPDILIIDFDTISDFKTEEFTTLKNKFPELKIAVLTANRNKETVYKILKQGIIHYVSKDCDADEFLNALNAIAGNEKYFCGFVLETLLNKKVWNAVDDNQFHLTNKEIEIIKLLTQGKTTKDIAKELFISYHTVNTHRKNILAKLQLKNTSELVMYAVKHGIVETIEYYI